VTGGALKRTQPSTVAPKGNIYIIVFIGYYGKHMVEDRTTVELEKKTRDKLKDLGKKGETYDELLNRLIDFYKERN
jgi:hypothetical protein